MSEQVIIFGVGDKVDDATKKGRGKGVVEMVEEHPGEVIRPDRTYLVLWEDGSTEAQVSPGELRPG